MARGSHRGEIVRSSLVLCLLFGLAAPVWAKEGLPQKIAQKIRSAERGDRLGLWETGDHLREGKLEAGYSSNTDNIIVSLSEGSVKRIYVVSGPGLDAHSVIAIPRTGEITVRSSKAANEEAWRKFLHGIGEKSAMHRKLRIEGT
jgi:hypothetical protein